MKKLIKKIKENWGLICLIDLILLLITWVAVNTLWIVGVI